MVMLAAMIAYPGDKIKGYVAVVFLLSVDSIRRPKLKPVL
jgi:hypothetical protein